ncbi:MAG: hypothetical protein Alpg2KO_28300 [Alphaproteobacteria bacterium]
MPKSRKPADPFAVLEDFIANLAQEIADAIVSEWQDSYDATEMDEERDAHRLLVGYLLTLHDGYNSVYFLPDWAEFDDPEWGTLMGAGLEVEEQPVDYLFKLCHRDQRRWLAIRLIGEGMESEAGPDPVLAAAGCELITVTDDEVFEDAAAVAGAVQDRLIVLMREMVEVGIDRPMPGRLSGRIPADMVLTPEMPTDKDTKH